MISLSSNTVCYTNILNKRVQAGWLPWGSESAKKCVTAYLLNQLDLKMEGQKKGESRTTVEMQETHEKHYLPVISTPPFYTVLISCDCFS